MTRLGAGPQVPLDGVPDGLVAHARVELRDTEDGPAAVRDRRGRLSLRHGVLLRAAQNPTNGRPPQVVPGDALPDATPRVDTCVLDALAAVDRIAGRDRRRWALGAGTRSASTWDRLPDGAESAVELARAGLVELHAEVVDGHALQPPERWTRTPLAEAVVAWIDAVDEARLDRLAFACDELDDGDGALGILVSTDPDAVLGPARTLLERRGWPARPHDELEALAAVDREVLVVAQRLLAELPLDRRPRSLLAVQLTGDTHALDDGEPLAGLFHTIVELWQDEVPDGGGTGRAERWDAAGVDVDGFASVAVAWGLPGEADHPLGGLLEHGRRHGVVVHVGLHPLRSADGGVRPPPAEAPGWVFTCENAALLQWAARQDLATPVVHTGGHASTATRELLARVANAGWRIAVGADLEAGGLDAAATLLDGLGPAAVPWRLGVDDYLAATPSQPPLTTLPAAGPWDPALLDAMSRTRGRVTEEDRWELLCNDLRAGAPLEH